MSEVFTKLAKMKMKWEELNIISHFVEVHHFSNEKFDSKIPTFYEHYDYCIDKNIRGENIQTLERSLKVAELFDDGLDIDDAIEQSWTEYPVLRN